MVVDAGTGSEPGSLLVNCTVAVFPAGTLVPRVSEMTVPPLDPPPGLMVEGEADIALIAGTTVIWNLVPAPAYVPVILAVAAGAPYARGVLPTVRVATVAPIGMVNVAGTVTTGLSLERLIVAPPIGARPFRSTVTVTGSPAMVVVADGVKPPNNGSVMMVFCSVRAPAVAAMMLDCEAITAAVVMGKVALVAPCATVTVGGTEIPAGAFKEKLVPPAGAVPFTVMVPVELVPPTISCGAIWNEFTGCKG